MSAVVSATASPSSPLPRAIDASAQTVLQSSYIR